jgi:hypothetical protein
MQSHQKTIQTALSYQDLVKKAKKQCNMGVEEPVKLGAQIKSHLNQNLTGLTSNSGAYPVCILCAKQCGKTTSFVSRFSQSCNHLVPGY